MDDLISRQQAIDALDKRFGNVPMEQTAEILMLRKDLRELPFIQPETNCSEFPNNSDTISRQAVIDAFETAAKGGASIEDIKLVFENLPSAQPDIIRCKDCKHSRFFDPCFYCYEMCGEVIVPENGFCFKAERRMNATD